MAVKGSRSYHKYVWNGSGMTSLTPAAREVVMKKASKRAKEQHKGWPDSVQKEGKLETYELANLEWARLIAASKSRKES